MIMKMEISTHIDIGDIEALKDFEYGLIMACPMDKQSPNPTDCPLHDIRLLSVEERIKWLDELSGNKCRELYQYHNNCFAEKMG